MLSLKCPICSAPLVKEQARFCCMNRHSFDLSADGYVNLLPANKKHSRMPGDNREMVAARTRFLNAGYYQLFSSRINELTAKTLGQTAIPAPAIADFGCGEGYYTARLFDFLRSSGQAPQMVGMDISKFAVRTAAKRNHAVLWAVANAFSSPLFESSIDFILSIFAPSDGSEFRRVLKDGGYVLAACPGAKHLWALKEIVYAHPYENEPADPFGDALTLLSREMVRTVIEIPNNAQIQDLFSMTPYFWKTSIEDALRLQKLDRLKTEISFDLLLYQKQ